LEQLSDENTNCPFNAMKAKLNEVALPQDIKRGRIDLTARREAVGLTSPMSQQEKEIVEARLKTAITDAVCGQELLRAHEASLKEKLQELKRNRKALDFASKNEASQGNHGGDKATT
jgi:hypothetical protein